MTDVYLESGAKRVVASAVEWPGWCRSGKDEAGALAALLAAAPRYAQIVQGAHLSFEAPEAVAELHVRGRLPGSAATDMAIPNTMLEDDAAPMSEQEQARAAKVLRACWDALDGAIAAAEGQELRKGPRGGGRDLEKIQRHVAEAEAGYVETTGARIKWDAIANMPAAGAALASSHALVLQALADIATLGQPPPGPRGGKRWPARYFVRRVAYHVVDHLWEIEDRLTPET